MTVSATTNKAIFLGNGATTAFTFNFPAVAVGDLQVYYTDASGNITLLNSTLYTVILNAAVAPNPTASGGTVTYPLIGSPIALGTTLTILRSLPEVQPSSFANQGTLYPATYEQALDYLTMSVQQINELVGRQITVAVSDSAPAALPPAAQRALQWFGFDAAGNPIAGAGPLNNVPISTAMQPVVAASTIAGALALLGLTGITAEPSGTVKAYAGSAAPTGYLLCSGGAVNRTTFSALFAVIGTTYGVGDGSTTFNLPDLRGRIPAGLDNMGGIAAGRLTSTTITGGATTLGNAAPAGVETNTLLIAQIPSHAHSITDPGHAHTAGDTQGFTTGGVGGRTNNTSGAVATTSVATGITVNNNGGGLAHNNVQPTLMLNWIIKT